jgi:hypothetical protein
MRTEVLALKDPLVSAESTADVASGFVALESLKVVDFAVVAPPKAKSWNPKWGTYAQWVGAIAALVVAVLAINNHIDKLFAPVDQKFKDIGSQIDTVDKKFGPVNQRLMDQEGKIGVFQGQMNTLLSGHVKLLREQNQLKDRMAQQQAITRLYNPDRILVTIRAEIQMANARNGTLPASELADYRNALRALPSSTVDYWQTVAAVINYQSLLNQMSHEAPDPAKVARPCIDENWIGNFIANHTFRNCIVSLDTNSFYNVTFQDSVIHYRGGGVELSDVKFVNCTFKLELTTQPVKPAQEKLLLAILNSNDQKAVRISR